MKIAYDDVHVGFVCGSYEAVSAVISVFDTKSLMRRGRAADRNIYTVGVIGEHAAASTLSLGSHRLIGTMIYMRNTFPNLRVMFVVNHATGVPDPGASPARDIRLGDVVVGVPTEGNIAGVKVHGYDDGITDLSLLKVPQQILLHAVDQVQDNYGAQGANSISAFIEDLLKKRPMLRDCGDDGNGYGRPEQTSDRLFEADYSHIKDDFRSAKYCAKCDADQEVQREERSHHNPVVHRGLIATYSAEVEYGVLRDKIKSENGAICIEKDLFYVDAFFSPLLAIRGISNYGDSHKNPEWAMYASLTAATFARHVLLAISPAQMASEKRLVEY
ncbi:hypothetical protein BDV06DRAFT_219177 [Aspergillus oleicola]